MRPEPDRPGEPLDVPAPPAARGAGATRAAGLLFGGLLLGVLLALLGGWLYFRSVRWQEAQRLVAERLRLPAHVWRLERVTPQGALRIALRDVALLGRGGDTLATVPLVRATLQSHTALGAGPIVLTDVELLRPDLRLVQDPETGWTILQAFRVTAGGEELRAPQGAEPGRGLLLRGVRVVDGDLRLLMPSAPEDSFPAGALARAGVRLTRVDGTLMRLQTARDVDARLELVRIGTARGWRAEVAALSASLGPVAPGRPEVQVRELRGVFQQRGETGLQMGIARLRTDRSVLSGGGIADFPAAGPQYDLSFRGEPADLRDVSWLVPALPDTGVAVASVRLQTQPNDRLRVTLRDASYEVGGTRVRGDATLLLGNEQTPVLTDTRLSFDPLALDDVEYFGRYLGIEPLAELAVQGEVRGTLRSDTLAAEPGGALQVDVLASLRPEQAPAGAEPSVVAVQGGVTLAEAEPTQRLRELRVQVQPLRLEALAGFLPEQRERLQGVLRGAVVLNGTPRALTLRGGELAYQVGSAPATRLADLEGSVTLDPTLRYDLSARAAPLTLGTLAALAPALPFRRAALVGPVRVVGTREEVRFRTDLRGDAGGLALEGSAQLGEPLRFDVSGRLSAFTPSAVLQRAPAALDGPLSGSFGARGSLQDFAFEVDLAQGPQGRFALSGQVRRPAGAPPVVALTGTVERFQLGALLGQPALFPAPLTGPVAVNGGGGQPYRFNLSLGGADEASLLAVQGFYAPGEVPRYQLSGRVAGLDVHRLPGAAALPPTRLNAALRLAGQGTTLETLAGQLWLDATRSSVANLPLDAARAALTVRDGVLYVDTLGVALAGTRFGAEGTWGLTRPVATPLRFHLASPDLSRLAPLLIRIDQTPRQLAGSVQAEGWVSGSARAPSLRLVASGSGLRYEAWQAQSLAADLTATRAAGQWNGRGTLQGENLALGGFDQLRTLRVSLNGGPQSVDVEGSASRADGTELALAAQLQLDGRMPRAVALRALSLRAADTRWQLQQPAHLRWGGEEGVVVDSLVLRRADGEGWVEVDGSLPRAGEADLRVRVAGLNVGELRRLLPQAPDVAGVISLDAALHGSVERPELSIAARVAGLRYGGVEADTLVFAGHYRERRLLGNAGLWITGGRSAAAELSLPMDLSLAGGGLPRVQLLRTEPLQARLVTDSLPVALLTAPFAALREGAGFITAEMNVRGTLESPRFAGWMALDDAALTVEPLGVRFEQIAGRLALDGDLIRIEQLTARSGGTATLTGTVRFDERGRPLLDLSATLAGFRPVDRRDLAALTTSGRLALTGRLPNPMLSGRLDVPRGTIAIPELQEQSPLELADLDVGQIGADTTLQAETGFGPALLQGLRVQALQVVIGDDVWLESPDARVQIDGDVVVNRAGDDLRLFGELRAVRGTYRLRLAGAIVREFDVVSGRVQFFGEPQPNPELNIIAAHEVRGGAGDETVRILVHITGTLQYPRLELTSDTRPPLPESELLSYLMFGRPSFGLAGGAGAVAQELFAQELFGSLFFSTLEQNLSELLTWCDYLRVRGSGADQLGNVVGALGSALGTTALACGIRLAPEWFFTLETGAVGTALGGLFEENPRFDPGALLSLRTIAARLEHQPNEQTNLSLSREPVRRDRILQFVDPNAALFQWSLQWRTRWEYGRSRADTVPPPRPPAADTVSP